MKAILLIFLSLLFVPAMAMAQSFLPVYQAGSGTFEVDYSIGGDMDDEDYFMFRPTDLSLDSQGNLFVLDEKGFCIKKFDPDGQYVKTFGRKGEGPGEIMRAFKMDIDPNDNIVIYDFGNNRFNVYDNDGNSLKSVGIGELGWRPISDLHIDGNGNLYMESRKIDFQRPDEPTQILISRIDLDTMAETTLDSASIKESQVRRYDQGMMVTSAPFHPELLWGVTSVGTIVLAYSDTYHIKMYSSEMKLKGEFRNNIAKREVTEKDKEEYFSNYDEDGDFKWVRNSTKFPKYKPYFEELIIDSEGYLLFQEEGDDEEIQLFEVFSPEGEYINRVQLPRLHRSAILTNGYIYTIQLPEDDDPVVVRYRLE